MFGSPNPDWARTRDTSAITGIPITVEELNDPQKVLRTRSRYDGLAAAIKSAERSDDMWAVNQRLLLEPPDSLKDLYEAENPTAYRRAATTPGDGYYAYTKAEPDLAASGPFQSGHEAPLSGRYRTLQQLAAHPVVNNDIKPRSLHAQMSFPAPPPPYAEARRDLGRLYDEEAQAQRMIRLYRVAMGSSSGDAHARVGSNSGSPSFPSGAAPPMRMAYVDEAGSFGYERGMSAYNAAALRDSLPYYPDRQAQPTRPVVVASQEAKPSRPYTDAWGMRYPDARQFEQEKPKIFPARGADALVYEQAAQFSADINPDVQDMMVGRGAEFIEPLQSRRAMMKWMAEDLTHVQDQYMRPRTGPSVVNHGQMAQPPWWFRGPNHHGRD